MSYIRDTSNPEGLYVFNSTRPGSRKVYTNIWWSQKPPLSSGVDALLPEAMYIIVPYTLFKKAALAWNSGKTKFSKDGFSVKEELIFMDTGKKVPEPYDILYSTERTEFQVKISYKSRFVYVYRVTWDYVTRSFEKKRG